MRVAAEGQAEAVSGLRQKVGVYGEGVGSVAEGGLGCEGGENGFVGAESWGVVVVAVAVGGAVKDGACERGWTNRCQARRGRSGVQRRSVAVSGGFAVADGGMDAASAAAPAVAV